MEVDVKVSFVYLEYFVGLLKVNILRKIFLNCMKIIFK